MKYDGLKYDGLKYDGLKTRQDAIVENSEILMNKQAQNKRAPIVQFVSWQPMNYNGNSCNIKPKNIDGPKAN